MSGIGVQNEKPLVDEPWRGRNRHWERDEDDEWAEDDAATDDPDAYELGDLINGEITLARWVDPAGEEALPNVSQVSDDEVCCSTPSSDLAPYASEYEGYMGNYRNTMDRWYRRAALVLWPRERAFAVRAEASPAWALRALEQRILAGEGPEARELAGAERGRLVDRPSGRPWPKMSCDHRRDAPGDRSDRRTAPSSRPPSRIARAGTIC